MCLLLTAVVTGGFDMIFSASEKPQLLLFNKKAEQSPGIQCYNNTTPIAVDDNGSLRVLVWNIYKQNRPSWKAALSKFSQDSQLVLLQEASLTKELKSWMGQGLWNGNAVDAFKAFETSAGVLNIARELPIKACAYTELEPWLRLPKSALYAEYALSNGQTLAVINVHSVNFTYGIEEYHHQLSKLVAELQKHQGPIIAGGDFNSWSVERVKVMQQAFKKVGLKPVSFEPDYRKKFVNGLPLDHIYYRNLTLETAEASQTDASDHNPLLARFTL
ncbi:endonuclease/exonuclease/phosphatase family protein [Vibrio sp. FNV 38]|nr:endonuclease/exonuclease/phosphatase family protein [Vibrio sp. FNV 38]